MYGVGIRDAEGLLGPALPIRELEQSPEKKIQGTALQILGERTLPAEGMASAKA